MKRLIVTATGTEVGKTWITAALTAQLLGRGVNVRTLKPLATGAALRPDDDVIDEGDTDAHVLAQAMQLRPTRATLNRINPVTLPEPLSPDMAAARVLRTLTVEELVRLCEAADDEWLVIEGIGGAMVPLNDHHTTLDWFTALDAPVVVVAGAYLGTLSHTLTTVAAIQNRGVKVASVVVSEREPGPVFLEETVESLEHHLDVPIVGVPQLSSFRDAPDLLRTLPPAWQSAVPPLPDDDAPSSSGPSLEPQ